MNPKTTNPKTSACKKLIKFTDSLLRSEINRYDLFDALSEDLYILRLIAKAYAISTDLDDEYRFPAVIMYLFAHCGAPEMGIRAISRLEPGILTLFYSEILDKRKELCPSAEVYTVLTHDGKLITRSNHGDEVVDLDPICVHASAVTPEGATKRRVVYVPNKSEYGDENYDWV